MIIQAQLVRRGAQSRHVAEVLNTVVGESSLGLQPVSYAFSSPHVNFLMAELTARNQHSINMKYLTDRETCPVLAA